MVKKLSCVSCGSLKRFPHTFTNSTYLEATHIENNDIIKEAKSVSK